MAAVFLVFGLGLPPGLSKTSLAQSTPSPSERPNIIFVMADDLEVGPDAYMPVLQRELVEEGTTFSNAFVTHSLCCPSRFSILLGQYSHNHQVLTNTSPLGGFEKFRAMGHEDSTVTTWLQGGGYRTVLVGKYLNGYAEADPMHVPPGWDEWYAPVEKPNASEHLLNENGTLLSYDAQEYKTDLLARKATDYVRRAADDPAPFFMYLAVKAPHMSKGAPRHQGSSRT